jgi:hypothetical protein
MKIAKGISFGIRLTVLVVSVFVLLSPSPAFAQSGTYYDNSWTGIKLDVLSGMLPDEIDKKKSQIGDWWDDWKDSIIGSGGWLSEHFGPTIPNSWDDYGDAPRLSESTVSINLVLNAFYFLAIPVAMFVMLKGAYLWVLSEGNPEKLKMAKNTITWGVVGLVFVLLVGFIVRVIALQIFGSNAPI